MNITPPIRVPLLDQRSGQLSREWTIFFQQLAKQASAGIATGTFTTVDAKTATIVDGVITELV